MALDTNEPSDPQVENSPTPTSAICTLIPHASEAPSDTSNSKLDDIISMMHKGLENMGNIVDLKLEKALAPINTQLRQLEGTPYQLDDFFPTWGQGDVDINSGLANYTTPE